jgi:tellurite resistance protein TehA-like permease
MDLGNVFVGLFLLFDNASVVMMMVGQHSYRTVRRISYSIFLLGIVWQLIAMAIVLRHSFGEESDLKKQLEEMTPVQFLERLNEIDE